MKKSVIAWIVVIIVVVVGIIIWMSYAGSNYVAPTSTTANTSGTQVDTTPTPTTPAVVSLVLDTATSTALGTYVVDPNGMTLYTYNKDIAGVSNCTGTCATTWPPYTVASAASLSGGAKITGTISAIVRTDGGVQITYKGLPLYYWASDSKPGDATGNKVNGFAVAKP